MFHNYCTTVCITIAILTTSFSSYNETFGLLQGLSYCLLMVRNCLQFQLFTMLPFSFNMLVVMFQKMILDNWQYYYRAVSSRNIRKRWKLNLRSLQGNQNEIAFYTVCIAPAVTDKFLNERSSCIWYNLLHLPCVSRYYPPTLILHPQ